MASEYISKIDKRYRHELPLTVRRGNIRNYLGMIFDYGAKHKVKIDMYEHIKLILEDLL